MGMRVEIVDYDPAWEQAFLAEKQRFERILKDNCVAVHHIGSTSVPGLAAKPVIDIMPVVKSLEAVDALAGEFEQLGYEVLGEFGIPGRRFMRRGGDDRTHNVHVFAQTDTDNINRHLGFRDYLRQRQEARAAYEALKRKLAVRFPQDIQAYNQGKDAFIKGIEASLRTAWEAKRDG